MSAVGVIGGAGRAATMLWTNLRLVVVDVETTGVKGEGQRCVSIGIVTCRGQEVTGRYSQLVDPEVPITKASSRKHGLRDEDVAGEPAFAAIANVVIAALTPRGNDRYVLVAHNAPFDVGVLRGEMARAELELPEMPVLDTMGRLAAAVGVVPAGKSLAALLDALDLTNAKPHDALADAEATAAAVIKLLAAAASNGVTDFDDLLDLAEAHHTTTSLPAAKPGRMREDEEAPLVPPEHLATHAELLARRPTKKALAAWRSAVRECAELRCDLLGARVGAAQAPAQLLRTELVTIVRDLAAAGDAAGTATVLGASARVLAPEATSTKPAVARSAAVKEYAALDAALGGLVRCGSTDRCPACRVGETCALDRWPLAFAVAAVRDPMTAAAARSFFDTNGKEAATGVWTTMRGTHPRLADEALAAVFRYWRENGHPQRANQLAALAWKAGCRHPELANAHARQIFVAGREVDLRQAQQICDDALVTANGSTDEAWTYLGTLRNLVAGRLARVTVRYGPELDQNGNPVPVRRREPVAPHRTRAPRFQRNA